MFCSPCRSYMPREPDTRQPSFTMSAPMTWSAWDLTTVSGPTAMLPDLYRQGRRTSSSLFNPFALSLALIHTRPSGKLPLRVHMSYTHSGSFPSEGGGGCRQGAGQCQPGPTPCKATSYCCTPPPHPVFCLSYCLSLASLHRTLQCHPAHTVLLTAEVFFFWKEN